MGGGVEGGLGGGDAAEGGLYESVHFGVKAAAQLVAFAGGDVVELAEAADFFAVLEAGWCAVVAGGEDPAVVHEHGAYVSAHAGGSPRDLAGDPHEIFVPGWSAHAGYSTRLGGDLQEKEGAIRRFRRSGKEKTQIGTERKRKSKGHTEFMAK